MSVTAKIVSQTGERLSRLDDVPLNPIIRAAESRGLPLLASADVHDDTFFNEKQVKIIRRELLELTRDEDDLLRNAATALLTYSAAMLEANHAQMVFVGD